MSRPDSSKFSGSWTLNSETMKKLAGSFFVFIMTLLALEPTQLATSRAWFTEITSNDDGGHTIFTKYFHRCSLNEQCNFIVINSMRRTFNEVLNLKDLPSNKISNTIWKRVTGVVNDRKDSQLNSVALLHCALDLSWGKGASTFRASCDTTTDGGGWTVIQRRVDANVSFDRNWDEFVKGFGDPLGNHWLGLEAMHQLTMKGNFTLRFDLKNKDGSHGFAEYENCKIADASENYKISFGKYRGNVGDALRPANGAAFTTKDKNNDKKNDKNAGNCAVFYNGAWWMAGCTDVHLNNLYPGSQSPEEVIQEMSWFDWKFQYGDLTFSEMKMRETN